MLCSDKASLLNVSSNMILPEGSLVNEDDSLVLSRLAASLLLALLLADNVYVDSMAYSVRFDSLILPVLKLFKSSS